MVFLVPTILFLIAVWNVLAYRKSSYYRVTKIPMLQMYADKGRLGEYRTFKHLRSAEKNGAKFLFNIYIPKGENETTEIDVLMIHAKGLFVFESKNYSGWIFGSEHQKNWYQTLPQGRGRSHKAAFYNPVMQNGTHIKHLKTLLGEEVPMHSIITFSERCTLKKVEITSGDVQVINRDRVYQTVAEVCGKMDAPALEQARIDEIYAILYPYTQVDAAAKAKHIEHIEKKLEQAEQPAAVPTAEKCAICPRCGGSLILRTASRGANAGRQFYGCSNYPKCRYMRNLETEEVQV